MKAEIKAAWQLSPNRLKSTQDQVHKCLNITRWAMNSYFDKQALFDTNNLKIKTIKLSRFTFIFSKFLFLPHLHSCICSDENLFLPFL